MPDEVRNDREEAVEQERDENRGWALKWDGAALAEMKGKRDGERWDRP